MSKGATTWITIPTYWGYGSGEKGEQKCIFDHPTPIDSEGTLGRLLESLRTLETDFNVLVIVGTTHPDIAGKAHDKVLSILKKYSGYYPVYLVSDCNLERVSRLVGNNLLSLDGYGSIRNLQLVIPYIADAQAVVGIDDDEIITDSGYLNKVLQYIGASEGAVKVSGMAGPYFDRNGEYAIEGADALESEKNIFIKKNFFMNQALKKVMDCGEVIARSNVAFGGNMCIHRSTIEKACFDPYIARGEDYDYVINAKMEGLDFYFRPDMGIVHLPPDSTGSQAGDNVSKLLADINRFIYMKEKMEFYNIKNSLARFDTSYLLPYPGIYLDPALDLESEAVKALEKLYPEYCENIDPVIRVKEAISDNKNKVNAFFDFHKRWKDVIPSLSNDNALKEAVLSFLL